VPAETDESLFTGYNGRLLLSLTGGSFFISLVAMVIPPLLPTIIADLGISSTQAGLVMTVWWLAVAASNAPGGRFADELSHKTGLVTGLLVGLVGVLLLTQSPVYSLLLVGVAVVGIGRGIYQPSSIGQIADLFVERRGQALGIRGTAFNFGGVISGVLVAGVLAVAGWRTTFVPILGGIVVVLAFVHVWNRDSYKIGRVRLNLLETFSRLGRSKELLLVTLALSLFGFIWNGSVSFLPSLLQFENGLSATRASVAFSGVFVVGVLTKPVYGRFGDRRGHAFAAFVAAILSAVGLVGLLAFDHLLPIAASLFVFAVGIAAFWPVMMSFALERLSTGTRTGDWGAITAVFLSSEALGSLYVGAVIDVANYTLAYASLLVVLFVTILVTFRVTALE
jgi:predicted MFS family arabinose efflux permease